MVFYAFASLKFWNQRWFDCPWMVFFRLKNDFRWNYNQNNFRIKFPDHENISVDTLIKLVCTKVCVLRPFLCFRLMAEHRIKAPWRQVLSFFSTFWTFYEKVPQYLSNEPILKLLLTCWACGRIVFDISWFPRWPPPPSWIKQNLCPIYKN